MKIDRVLCPLLFLLVSVSTLCAQSSFQVMLPSYTLASKRAVAATPEGGICILAQDTAFNIVLIKLFPDGTVEWGRRFPISKLVSFPISLRLTEDGGFLAMGNIGECITSTDSYGEELVCDPAHTFLLRFSPHGYPLWGKMYRGGTGADIAVNDLGEIAVIGRREKEWGAEERGEGTYAEDNVATTTLFQLDRDGEIKWGRDLNNIPLYTYDEISRAAVCLRNSGEITLTTAIHPEDNSDNLSAIIHLSARGYYSPGATSQFAEGQQG